MTTLVVLFNLKPDAAPDAYEAWARSTDIPTVRALPSNGGFEVYKTLSVRRSDAPPPYQYVELIHIADMDQYAVDVASETMQQIGAQLRTFADSPMFIVSERIEP